MYLAVYSRPSTLRERMLMKLRVTGSSPVIAGMSQAREESQSWWENRKNESYTDDGRRCKTRTAL